MNNYLPTDYQNFIALSRYARWKDDEQRRETWGETVERYFDYMEKHLEEKHNYVLCQMTCVVNLKLLCLTKTSCQA